MATPEITLLQQRVAQLESALAALQQAITVSNGSVAINAAGSVSITAGLSLNAICGQNLNITAGANLGMTAGQNFGVTTGFACDLAAGTTWKAAAGKEVLVKGKTLLLEGRDSAETKTGDASLRMKKDGTIDLRGKDITLDATGRLTGKATSDVVMKGSKILQN